MAAQAVGRQRDGLRVIARARRHHSGVEVLLAEAAHLVERPPDLERARELEALGLHDHLAPDAAGELTRRKDGGLTHLARDEPAGALDVVSRDDSFRVLDRARGHASRVDPPR